MQLNKHQILEIVNKQLLFWIKKDEAVKDAVINLVNTKYPTKKETDDKFERMLQELAIDREVQTKKWEAWEKKWDIQKLEDEKKWEAWEKKWDDQKLEDKKKWDDQKLEDKKKWDDQKLEDKKKWDDQKLEDKKKWDENQKNINKILDEIKAMNRKHEQSIGAIGARWGIRTEASFRNALTGILEEINSKYEITHYKEHDSEGIVYGEPQDIEIDVVLKNGKIYLIEISSNIKMSDIRTFTDKIKFYEKQHKQKVYKLLIVSPWIDVKTTKLAVAKGFKIFSYIEEVIL